MGIERQTFLEGGVERKAILDVDTAFEQRVTKEYDLGVWCLRFTL